MESAAEILERAKSVPLYLEASLSGHRWYDVRFSTFRKELQARIPHIRQLRIRAASLHLYKTLKRIASPAPTLDYLSLSSRGLYRNRERTFIPDTLFDGSTPRLSCLKLCYFNISWKEPLLKGLKYLEVITPAKNARPELAVWLGALDEMRQLRTLTLHSASPIAPSFPIDIERTTTLPSLTRLDISASPLDCALALAYLDLPALTWLRLTAISFHPSNDDVRKILTYVIPHVHGPQDAQPLQSAVFCWERDHADLFAWPVPDIDVKVRYPPTKALRCNTRMVLSFRSTTWMSSNEFLEIHNTMLAGLPLNGLVTLVPYFHHDNHHTEKVLWPCLSRKWPLLQRVHLTPLSARFF
jgi:hypothetical protein